MEKKMKFLLLVFASLFLVGCEKQEVKTYNVPKEINALIDTKNKDLEKPSVIVKEYSASIPDGWIERGPSGMRKVSYIIQGSNIDFYAIANAIEDAGFSINKESVVIDTKNTNDFWQNSNYIIWKNE